MGVQLEALQCNDEPWANHGVQTAYEFALDVGGLDPSWYFGFRKGEARLDRQALGELVETKMRATACDVWIGGCFWGGARRAPLGTPFFCCPDWSSVCLHAAMNAQICITSTTSWACS